MAWRVHLSNQAIMNLHILSGKEPLLVAWTQRDRATYFALDTGQEMGEHKHTAVGRQSDRWADFLASLNTPAGTPLPLIRTAQFTLLTTEDGKLRLYRMASGDLLLELDGQEVKLELNLKSELVALALDRVMGVIAVLDGKGKLHLAQQNISVGAFDLKLTLGEDAQPAIAIANGGSAIFITDGHDLLLADTSGKVKKRLGVHYLVRRIACSPNGKYLVTSDLETGVIRVYDGEDLTPSHQRHAIDLLQDAAQLQLLADLPPVSAAPSALVIDDKGNVAFSISGVVCLTTLKELDALPRPTPLL
jgi:WD40 repeat protein